MREPAAYDLVDVRLGPVDAPKNFTGVALPAPDAARAFRLLRRLLLVYRAVADHWPRALATRDPDPCLEHPGDSRPSWWLARPTALLWPNGYAWRMLRHHRRAGHWWPMVQ